MDLLDIKILQKEKLIGPRVLTPNVCPCWPPHRVPDVQTPADWTTLFRQLVPIQHTHEAAAVTQRWPQSALGLWGLGGKVPPASSRGGLHLQNSRMDGRVDRYVKLNSHTHLTLG